MVRLAEELVVPSLVTLLVGCSEIGECAHTGVMRCVQDAVEECNMLKFDCELGESACLVEECVV